MKFFLSSLFVFASCFAMSQYVLVWSDEFSGDSIDNTKWQHEIGGWGWGNNELQYYTSSPNNSSVSNDKLTITALQESFGGNTHTSARIITKDLMEVRYGKVEARIKCPMGQGIWPAFWMLGENIDVVSWPKCGEIDIMEHINNENKTHGTVHWDNGGHVYQGVPVIHTPEQFHVYSIVWDSTKIQWLLDGNIYYGFNITNGVNGTSEFHEAFYLLLNVAVGGNWPGYPDATTTFPAKLEIDYVRVYKDQSELSLEEDAFDYVSISPNPAKDVLKIQNLPSEKSNKIEIYDLSGKVCQIAETNGFTSEIDVSSLISGIYILELTVESGVQKRMKFIKE